jgi:hypothetical protein
MSNSSRIENATRQHVGATLTSAQITDLVHAADPNWKGGVYPSVVKKDAAPVTPVPAPAPVAQKKDKKAPKSFSQPPSATKSKANLARQVQ